MRIKLLKMVQVGKVQFALNPGTVIDADDQEAKALIMVGYAKETSEKLTDDPYYGAKAAGIKHDYDAAPAEDSSAGQIIGPNAKGQADAASENKDAGKPSQNKAK